MMKIFRFQSFIVFFLSYHGFQLCKPGIVVVPVADLLGNPVGKKVPSGQIEKFYAQLPMCAGKNCDQICPRIHQLLFNEIVDITKELGSEIQIAVPNLFFVPADAKKPHNLYWTLKKNVLPLHEIKNLTKNNPCFPDPIDYAKPSSIEQKSVVTLKYPYFSPEMSLLFSAGTRFVLSREQSDSFMVNIFDPIINEPREIAVPKNVCFAAHGYSRQQRIEQFVQLLRSWATLNQGNIPYVWGGASFTGVMTESSFTQVASQGKKDWSYYAWSPNEQKPKCGFDCTNLTARAAQICGIPYFLKNSVTIKKMLTPLNPQQELHEGDLIWVPGHVMIVGDLKHNTLIEARHYAHGYGKIQEIGLNKVFKDIKTYEDLKIAYQEKKPLLRIDKQGEVKDVFKEFTIFPLAQVWTQKRDRL